MLNRSLLAWDGPSDGAGQYDGIVGSAVVGAEVELFGLPSLDCRRLAGPGNRSISVMLETTRTPQRTLVQLPVTVKAGMGSVLLAVSLSPLGLREMGKAEDTNRRRSELVRLAKEAGFRHHSFSWIHMRIYGNVVIDYWPTKGKCWRTGSSEKSVRMEPAEAIDIAMGSRRELISELGDEQQRHMDSITDDVPPWEERQ